MSLSAYWIFTAIFQIITLPIADRFGSRLVLLARLYFYYLKYECHLKPSKSLARLVLPKLVWLHLLLGMVLNPIAK